LWPWRSRPPKLWAAVILWQSVFCAVVPVAVRAPERKGDFLFAVFTFRYLVQLPSGLYLFLWFICYVL